MYNCLRSSKQPASRFIGSDFAKTITFIVAKHNSARDGECSSLNSALEVNTQGDRCVSLNRKGKQWLCFELVFATPRVIA